MSTITFEDDRGGDGNTVDDVLDRLWLKNTFLMPETTLDKTVGYKQWLIKNRYRTSADAKFTSTAVGLNGSCNPRPQFTRYADIRSKGKLYKRPDVSFETPNNTVRAEDMHGYGMGGYYSQAIDDTAQRIYMRFGTPMYTPITAWMSNVFDPKRAVYANRGVLSTAIIGVADVASTAAAIVGAPFLALGLAALTVYNVFTNTSSSRFFSMRPSMHEYWLAVEDMVNSLVAKRTLLPSILPEYHRGNDSKLNEPRKITDAFIKELNTALPDIFKENGRISIFGLALRAQGAFNRMWHTDYIANMESPLGANYTDYPKNAKGEFHDTYMSAKDGSITVASKLFERAHELWGNSADVVTLSGDPAKASNNIAAMGNSILINPLNRNSKGEIDATIPVATDGKTASQMQDEAIRKNVKENQSWFDRLGTYFLDELTGGAGFAVFSVDSTGTSTASFSNGTQANPLEATLNGLSSKARTYTSMISSAGSAVTQIPLVGEIASLIGGVATVIASNASWGLANPLLALLYGVNIELPKMWESATTDFPKADYKIKCIAPYGNAMSQLINVYVPLAMVLAGGLPRGTGSQSYGSPFICQVYDRGRVQNTLGMISSISVTRGTSNLPFNRKGQANAVDIDFSVVNLDSVMFAPISTGGLVGDLQAALSPLKEDNTFTDYLSAVAGLDVMTQIYGIPKLRLHMATALMKLGRYTDPDPAYFASLTAGVVDSVLVTIATGGLNKVLTQNNASVAAGQ